MKKTFVCITLATAIAMPMASAFGSGTSLCEETDSVCREFETLADADQFEAIIRKTEAAGQYSAGARHYIGRAYLALAASESNTPEQEEAYCRKALEYGAIQANMGLYFIHVQKDEEKALSFLREYVKMKPSDSVAYVLLGESEFGKKNYQLADTYLREAKRISRADSPHVAWLLFQANYLLGDFEFAGRMLEAAFKNGNFEQELKKLSSDARFQNMKKQPEFTKFRRFMDAAEK